MGCAAKENIAELRDYKTAYPKMILCDAASTHGGIGKSYGTIPVPPFGVPAVGCNKFDKEVSWKMDTLGATILHEYTHYMALMAPHPLLKETADVAYGPHGVQHMQKKHALYIGDSYNWFATENLWTNLCNTNYLPALNKGDDPGCFGVCKAFKG